MVSDNELLSSYQRKIADNKQPSAAEKGAYQRAVESRIIEQLKSARPAFFNDVFGIQNKQRYDWADRYNFPCGRELKEINCIAVVESFRKLIADNSKFISVRRGEIDEDEMSIQEAKRIEAIEKTKKLKAQNSEHQIRLRALRREMVPEEDIKECFDTITNIYTRIAKQLQKTGHDDAWEIVKSALDETLGRYDDDILASGLIDSVFDDDVESPKGEEA